MQLFTLVASMALLASLVAHMPEYDAGRDADEGPQNDFSNPTSLRNERLVIRNQVAYHFRRIVNEVSQGMFISASINITRFLHSVELLQEATERVEKLCNKLPNFHARRVLSALEVSARTNVETYDSSDPSFILINEVREVSRAEAKAICSLRGLRLPELYTDTEKFALASYLAANHVSACFAGLEMDVVAGYTRFITTGLPIWKGVHTVANHTRLPLVSRPLDIQMELLNAEYIYDASGELHFHEMGPEAVSHHGLTKVGNFYSKADRAKILVEFKARVVCSPQYPVGRQNFDWLYFDDARQSHLSALKYESYLPGMMESANQSMSYTTTVPSVAPYNGFAAQIEHAAKVTSETDNKVDFVTNWDRALVQKCHTFMSRLNSTKTAMILAIEVELKDVGIEIQLTKRRKRTVTSAAQFFLQGGVELFQSLSELARLLPTINGTSNGHSLFFNLTEANKMLGVGDNTDPKYFELLTKIIKDSAISVARHDPVSSIVEIRFAELNKLMDAIEGSLPAYRPAFDTQMDAITSIGREIQHELLSACQWISKMVQSSLSRRTWAHLFPQASIDLANQWLEKRATGAMVGKEIYLRPTHLVIDPDRKIILAVVDAMAVSKEPLELVELIPIPFFESGTAHQPALDYNFVALNQMAGTFRPLTKSEADACMVDYCYIYGVELPTSTKHCGITQLLGRHLYDCQFESSASTGLYLRAVPPEGVIYSIANSAVAQLFCNRNVLVGQPTLLKGVGTVYIPPGCTMVVDDHRNPPVKVKGTPSHFHVDVPNAIIALEQPALTAATNWNLKPGVVAINLLPLPELLSTIRQSIDINKNEITMLSAKMWGCITFLVIIIGSLIVCLQLVGQKSKRSLPKETFYTFQKDMNSKLEELAKLRTRISFLQSLIQLEQMSLRDSNAPKPDVATGRATLPTRGSNPYSKSSSLSVGCVKETPYPKAWYRDMTGSYLSPPMSRKDNELLSGTPRDISVIIEQTDPNDIVDNVHKGKTEAQGPVALSPTLPMAQRI